jgi:hypothetical protein
VSIPCSSESNLSENALTRKWHAAFISTEISYGLFLADHSIINLVESELVILPAIMCQNLPGPTLWHLRGYLRAGVSAVDTERIQQCIEMIARYAERPIDKIGRVEDVKEELHDF